MTNFCFMIAAALLHISGMLFREVPNEKGGMRSMYVLGVTFLIFGAMWLFALGLRGLLQQ